jgi:hypothetical protein
MNVAKVHQRPSPLIATSDRKRAGGAAPVASADRLLSVSKAVLGRRPRLLKGKARARRAGRREKCRAGARPNSLRLVRLNLAAYLGLVRKLPNRPLIELDMGSQPVSDTICCSGDRYRTHQRAVFGGGPVSR